MAYYQPPEGYRGEYGQNYTAPMQGAPMQQQGYMNQGVPMQQQGYMNQGVPMQQGYMNQGVPMQQGYMNQGGPFAPKGSGKGAKGFLIFMLILILAGGLTVGGIFIAKALKSSDDNEGEATTSSYSDKDGDNDYIYADGEFTYEVNPNFIRVDVDATDGRHIKELKLSGVGDIDRMFPKFYEKQSQSYSWGVYFENFYIALCYEGNGETGSVHPSEMEAVMKVTKGSNVETYDIDFEVKDGEIIFKNFEIPENADFDLYEKNRGCSVYITKKNDTVADVYNAEFFVNGDRYDYIHNCLYSQINATTENTEATTEQKTEAATTEGAAGYNPSDEDYFIQGTFFSADPNLSGGSESTLTFYPSGNFYMNINFGEGFCEYEGTYTTSNRQSEMDDLYVYLTFDKTTNGIPKNATVVFTDTPDYCEFLTEGFGLIGYGDPPYGFYRGNVE